MNAGTRVAVLFSGRGSNLEALAREAARDAHPAHIVAAISDTPDAGGFDVAARHGIEGRLVDRDGFASRAAFEDALHEALILTRAELVCLAGFMRILSADFVAKWPSRILNIHPSLLPSFKGLHTHERALGAGVRIHGATVHLVTDELDGGPILAQAAVPVLAGDDAKALGGRVLAAEHQLYPAALANFIAGGPGTRTSAGACALFSPPLS